MKPTLKTFFIHPLAIPALGVALLQGLLCSTLISGEEDHAQSPNILFISIDDLRNDLGSLGVDHAHTPHLDAFAEKGRLFSRHYAQVPTCGASRAALLSGMRPSAPAHVNNNAIRSTHEDWGDRSLPAWFRQHGYKTLSLGKITHYPGGLTGRNWAEGPEELPGAWDRSWVPESPWESPEAMMHGYANGRPRDRGESPPLESYDGPDTAYSDAWVANEAIEVLAELAEHDAPWFFAVGFFKPHLPFAAPRRWFDLHDPEEIPAPANTQRHPGPSGWHGSGEMMGNYGHDGRDPRTDLGYAKELRHGYAAATSYVDEHVGRVLRTFEDLGLGENTIVVIWSDHGFNLGEHGIWGKHSLYEESLKAPLLIWYPGIPDPGKISEATVETVDLFPTLTELSGIRAPESLDGQSLSPHLTTPGSPSSKPAFGHFRNQRSVRNDDWRLIEHSDGLELFDFREIPHGERVDPEDHASVVEDLLKALSNVPSF